MILNVYATRNKKSGQFGKIDLQIMDKKTAIESYSISVLEADEKSKILLAELDLYYLGTYDTATGLIDDNKPELLIDLGAVSYGKDKKD